MRVQRIIDGAFHLKVGTNELHNLTGLIELSYARYPGRPSLDDIHFKLRPSQALGLIALLQELAQSIDEDRQSRFDATPDDEPYAGHIGHNRYVSGNEQ